VPDTLSAASDLSIRSGSRARVVCAILLCAACCDATLAQAQEPCASALCVVEIKPAPPGDDSLAVRVIQPAANAPTQLRLKAGAPVPAEIEWQVPAKTVVHLQSSNGNTIVLEPNTVFRATAVSSKGEIHSLCEGRGFFSVSNPLSFFNVTCKRFVALVRGTQFSVTVQPRASIQFDVTEGRVLVSRDVKVSVEGGQRDAFETVESELLSADCPANAAGATCKSSARYPINEDEFLPRRFANYDEALGYFRAQIDPARAASNYSALQRGLFGAGTVAQRTGKLNEALAYYQQSLDAARAEHDSKREAWALNNIGLAQFDLGHYASSAEYQQQALAIRRQLYRDRHRELADSYNNLAIAEYALDHYCAALGLHGKALAMRQWLYPDGAHGDVAQSLSNLGAVYFDLGRFQQAQDYHQQALALRQRLYRSGNHPDIASNLYNLGKAVQETGDLARAQNLFRETRALAQKLRITRIEANAIDAIGTVLRMQGDAAAALRQHEQALKLRSQLFGERHPSVAASWNNLGEDYTALKQWQEALRHHERALTLRLEIYPPGHLYIAQSRANLGAVFATLGEYARATDEYQQAIDIQRNTYPNATHPKLASNYAALASVREAAGDSAGAARYRAEAEQVQRRLSEPINCPNDAAATASDEQSRAGAPRHA
jgi:tetratricopeptide (TPR) repeat protein